MLHRLVPQKLPIGFATPYWVTLKNPLPGSPSYVGRPRYWYERSTVLDRGRRPLALCDWNWQFQLRGLVAETV